jgi:hypothetical protein
VDAHGPVTAVNFLKRIAVRGERQDPRAEKCVGLRTPGTDDRKQSCGVGVAVAPTTTLKRRTARPPRETVSVRLAREISAAKIVSCAPIYSHASSPSTRAKTPYSGPVRLSVWSM